MRQARTCDRPVDGVRCGRPRSGTDHYCKRCRKDYNVAYRARMKRERDAEDAMIAEAAVSA